MKLIVFIVPMNKMTEFMLNEVNVKVCIKLSVQSNVSEISEKFH